MPVQTAEQERFLCAGLERDPVFRALWAGERRYGNESSDDQALMNKLAYWCSADSEAMIGAFIRSPHHAQKDEAHKAKCRRADYLLATAQKSCANVYSTAAADHERWKQGRHREKSHAR
jgi:putative DNA primase/helicase